MFVSKEAIESALSGSAEELDSPAYSQYCCLYWCHVTVVDNVRKGNTKLGQDDEEVLSGLLTCHYRLLYLLRN